MSKREQWEKERKKEFLRKKIATLSQIVVKNNQKIEEKIVIPLIMKNPTISIPQTGWELEYLKKLRILERVYTLINRKLIEEYIKLLK